MLSSLQKTTRTLIHISGGKRDIEEGLKTVSGILNLSEKGEISPDVFAYEIESEKEISGELSYLVFKNKWKLVEMRAVKMSLEDIFIELVTKEEGVQ